MSVYSSLAEVHFLDVEKARKYSRHATRVPELVEHAVGGISEACLWVLRRQLTFADLAKSYAAQDDGGTMRRILSSRRTERNAGELVTRAQQLRILLSTSLVAFTVIGKAPHPTSIRAAYPHSRLPVFKFARADSSRIYSVLRCFSGALWSHTSCRRGRAPPTRYPRTCIDLVDWVPGKWRPRGSIRVPFLSASTANWEAHLDSVLYRCCFCHTWSRNSCCKP